MIYTVILFLILRQTRPTILCHEHYDTLNTQHSFVEHQETQIRFKILTISTKMAVVYSTSILFGHEEADGERACPHRPSGASRIVSKQNATPVYCSRF
jgi:hypothetical protein